MRIDGVIAVVMVLAAVTALIIWELSAHTNPKRLPDVLVGQDIDLSGAMSQDETHANYWAAQADWSQDPAYNRTAWMG